MIEKYIEREKRERDKKISESDKIMEIEKRATKENDVFFSIYSSCIRSP